MARLSFTSKGNSRWLQPPNDRKRHGGLLGSNYYLEKGGGKKAEGKTLPTQIIGSLGGWEDVSRKRHFEKASINLTSNYLLSCWYKSPSEDWCPSQENKSPRPRLSPQPPPHPLARRINGETEISCLGKLRLRTHQVQGSRCLIFSLHLSHPRVNIHTHTTQSCSMPCPMCCMLNLFQIISPSPGNREHSHTRSFIQETSSRREYSPGHLMRKMQGWGLPGRHPQPSEYSWGRQSWMGTGESLPGERKRADLVWKVGTGPPSGVLVSLSSSDCPSLRLLCLHPHLPDPGPSSYSESVELTSVQTMKTESRRAWPLSCQGGVLPLPCSPEHSPDRNPQQHRVGVPPANPHSHSPTHLLT